MAKRLIGILAAGMFSCAYGNHADENTADAGACASSESARAGREEQRLPPELETYFAQCRDGLYDFDTRCIDFTQGYIEISLKSAYHIKRVARYKQNGQETVEIKHCSSALLENGYLLTAKHCVHFKELEIRGGGVRHDKEFFLLNDGKEYGLEIVLEGQKDFAVLKLKKDADLPYMPFAFGKAEELTEGNLTYLFGYIDDQNVNFRPGTIATADEQNTRWGKGYFLINNGSAFGDSGGLVIGFRDGKPEFVGINCYKHEEHEHAGGVLRAEEIMKEAGDILNSNTSSP